MSGTYDYFALHQPAPVEPSKYFGLSIFVHSAIAVAALLITVPAMDNIKKEVITIEFEAAATMPPPPEVKTMAAAKGEVIKATQGSAPTVAPAVTAPLDAKLDTLVKGPAQTSRKSHSPIAKMKTHTGQGAKAIPVAHSAPSRAGVPETIEDIAAPELNFDGVVAAQQGKLGDDELEDDFKKVDRSNAAAIQAQKAELDNEMKQVSDEKDEALNSLEEDNKAQARAMENAMEAKRTKNAAAVAQLKAAEDAAKEKAAQEKEIVAAKAKAAAGRAQNNIAGKGSDSSGVNQNSANSSGEPNGVRSLDQLRQVPGNPKPQYSVEERMQRQQGLVAFYAYVTKAGQP
jgi:hypothetical protein